MKQKTTKKFELTSTWMQTSTSKNRVKEKFNDIYAGYLNYEFEDNFSSDTKNELFIAKTFGSYLLDELAQDNEFVVLPVGRYFSANKLDNAEYREFSRFQLVILRHTTTDAIFFVDAGGLLPAYLKLSQDSMEQASFKEDNKIHNSRDKLSFVPLRHDPALCQLVVGLPDDNEVFCADLSDLPTLPKENEAAINWTGEKLLGLVSKISERVQERIQAMAGKMKASAFPQETLEKYAKSYAEGTLGNLTLCTSLDQIQKEFIAKGDENPVNIDRHTDFSQLEPNQPALYFSVFPGRETILMRFPSEMIIKTLQNTKVLASKISGERSDDILNCVKMLQPVFTDKFQNRQLDPELIVPNEKISIEDFIAKKQGVCRHIALFAAFLVGRLVKENKLPPGKVTHYRHGTDTLRSHTLVIYKPHAQNIHYLIDYTQGIFLSISNQPEFEVACEHYRNKGLAMLLHRFAEENEFTLPKEELDPPLTFAVIEKLEKRMDEEEKFEAELTEKNLICPITGLPISDPVKIGSEGKQFFEKWALENWVKKHKTCPLTRKTVGLNDIKSVPEAKKLLFTLAVNEGRGITPEEVVDVAHSMAEPNSTALRYKQLGQLGLARNILEDKLKGPDELSEKGKKGLEAVKSALQLYQTQNKRLGIDNKKFLELLHSHDDELEGDLYAKEIIANIALFILGAGVVYGVVQGIHYAVTGKFFLFKEERKEQRIISELEGELALRGPQFKS